MISIRRHLLVVSGLLWPTLAGGAHAQVAPGSDGMRADRFRAEYYAEVLEGVNRALEAWGEVLSNDRIDDLAELYAENAVLVSLDGETARGRDGVVRHLTGALPGLGRVDAFMQDFDASGALAVVYGSYMLERRLEDGTVDPSAGELFTVLVRDGRSWRIRFQSFRPPS